MVGEMFANASIVGKLGILIAFGPVVCALLYAYKPTERRLALMRPLSLAAIFGGLTSFTSGVAIVMSGISATGEVAKSWRAMVLGGAETFVALFVMFAALTIAWLLVALGMRRTA
jgi:hypothetical protein